MSSRPAGPRRRRLAFSAIELLEDRRLLAGIGIYNPANDTFTLRKTANAGAADAGQFQLSAPGAIPVVGDWNGDGQDDFGVFDASTATWSLRYGTQSGTANAGVFQFGTIGGMPVVGDWNGDGRDDIGTYKAGDWVLRYGASPGLANAGSFHFGDSTLKPVVGDWNGDGRDGIGTFNASTAQWTLRQTASASGVSAGVFTFGPTGGIAVTGDWDGDGRDGVGVFQTSSAKWTLRQTANAGSADAGTFVFGVANRLPVTGDFTPPPAPEGAIASVVLPPINLDLLGLEIRTSPITVHVSTNDGNGKLLGNLLHTVSTLVDLKGASNALNQVLGSTVDLLNSAQLNVSGTTSGSLDNAAASNTQILELFVAPVHLDLLGVVVDTSTIRVTLTTHTGNGLILGNAVTSLINLFNPPLPDKLDLDYLNGKLHDLLGDLDQQIPGIASAPVPAVPISDGQILNVTVPPLDVNLLGLKLETSPITVNASASTGDGLLLGNVLTTALKTIDATPQALSDLNTNIDAILAKVVGVLNASNLTLASGAVDALPPALQTLLRPTLTAPAAGASAPVLDLMIASPDGQSPPVDVELLGLSITTSNIDAHLRAVTGDGQILGNLMYNLANMADPGSASGLLNLLTLIGAGNLSDGGNVVDKAVIPGNSPPQELLTLTVKPLHIDLLGLELRTDPIIVTLSAQAGDGKLLGNLLEGITTLINVNGVSSVVNNVLSTTVELLNASSLHVGGVGSGDFDNAEAALTPVLDLYVAPVHLDLLGLLATTAPIHLTILAQSGNGLVLGNVVHDLANVFNPPLPDKLTIDDVNQRLADLITKLDAQIPNIPPAQSPQVKLGPGQFLGLTVPALNVNLLGLVLQTSPITVNATATTGNGLLLGNILTTVLNTVDATTENLTGLNSNLNKLLAKVVGVLNASNLVLPTGLLGELPSALTTLATPTLVSAHAGATTPILDLLVTSGTHSGPPVDVDLLGVTITTSNIHAKVAARTGNGQILGNLLYNVANLLNPGGTSVLLSLLAELGKLAPIEAPRIDLGGVLNYTENTAARILAGGARVFDINSTNFNKGQLVVSVSANVSTDDRLEIHSQGTAAGQISVSGNNVLFGGQVIGTFSGGVGSTPLTIKLNASATVAAAQALVRNISFRSLNDAVSTLTRTISFQLSDGTGFTGALANKIVYVIGVNDAPVLNNALNPKLVTIQEDDKNPTGTQIAALLKNAVTDADSNALRGIAVTGASNAHGTWQYALVNSSVWVALGSTSEAAARLLPGSARIRFVPAANFNGGVKLYYRAWDQTQGAIGGTLKVSGNVGGSKSLSVAYESALQAVTAVNDAPVLAMGTDPIGYQHNKPAIILAADATVQDVDSPNFDQGVLRLHITDGAGSANELKIAGGFSVDSSGNVKQGTTVIGKLTANGVGTNDLAVTFNAHASSAIVQQLVRGITFRTHGGSTGKRSIVFTLSDGDGGTGASDPVTKTVNVT
jgi:hypothetical protein